MLFLLVACNSNSKSTSKAEKNEVVNNTLQITNKTEYPVQIPIGTKCFIDLDKDGSNDSVFYTVDTIKSGNHKSVISLKVNNTEYKDKLFGELGFYMDTANSKWYYIVDIDKTDNFKEIAILDEGPSGDPQTYFLRYNGNELKYIGSIPDFPREATCKFTGDGTIIASCRLSILQTWSAPMKWELDENGHLKEVYEDMYYPYNEYTDSPAPKLHKDFFIYTKRDLKAEKIMVSAGSKVTFISTDNKHWVCMKTEDGKEGWFYMEDFSHILNDGKQVESTLIFENLYFAG